MVNILYSLSNPSEHLLDRFHLFTCSSDLHNAIQSENYSLAAELRDKIAKLEAVSLAATATAQLYENAQYAFRLGQKVRHKIFGNISSATATSILICVGIILIFCQCVYNWVVRMKMLKLMIHGPFKITRLKFLILISNHNTINRTSNWLILFYPCPMLRRGQEYGLYVWHHTQIRHFVNDSNLLWQNIMIHVDLSTIIGCEYVQTLEVKQL